ncbi:general secretion pathway protein GspD [Sinomicrobium pectinilyticum]|uniref:General secretion pathway protein GspD n=1 Tax=Sinomicrobium pectinilyticum TaxID=1084421 RepID=A0A3N0EL64_SINP1|nr:general secretion pathway protein GspD [Sinomicrobium pectinilyticum]RNL88487.1 general secretion pathway protein GspD [Sinomicrobium pectinilyticum]
MIKKITLCLFLCIATSLLAQDNDSRRIESIRNHLESLSVDNPGLTESFKTDINVNNVPLSGFLMAVSRVHKVNINVSPELQNITIVNNFSDVTVADLLVFLCKEYQLDIDFTGNILSIHQYTPPEEIPEEKAIRVQYDPADDLISMDLDNDPLGKVFRKIIDISGHNLLYSSELENTPLRMYLKDVDFDKAMENLAATNNLIYSKSRDGFYLFDAAYLSAGPEGEPGGNIPPQNRPMRAPRGANFYYEVLDTTSMTLKVDFNNTPVANIINEIGYDLKLDIYTATPLENAGSVTFKAKSITFDELLEKIFESGQPLAARGNNRNSGNNNNDNNGIRQAVAPSDGHFTFKKEGNIYFFGMANQLSVRKVEIVQLMHRSVELLGDPSGNSGSTRSSGRTVPGGINYLGGGFNSGQNMYGNSNTYGNNNLNRPTSSLNTSNSDNFSSYNSKAEALVNILPGEIIADLDIKIDFELNSFLVSGPAANINRFKSFIKQMDKPVPVILIEVMLLEVSRTATVETGISWGIGDKPTKTKGGIFPNTDLTLGAETVNRVIGGFDGFGSLNVGKVVPEFFATIKAMEANGNVKIRSTPKLSTLNGHRAHLSIGETTYYVVTNQNYYGSQIPQSSEIRNYMPIDAELAVSIKPLVSGDGQITLDINVIQSDFSGERIEEDAPPGLTSREFSSIIRVQDQDLVVLGGLEEKMKNDSGSGVPLLSRIPIIKWLFSSRKREDSKKKLTVLIKPTVIY